jgi:hypothetical protein
LDRKKKGPFPWPPMLSRFYSYRFLRVCKRYCTLRKGVKCWWATWWNC